MHAMIVVATRSGSIDALPQHARDTDPYATPWHWFYPSRTTLLPHYLTTSPPRCLTA